MPVKINWAMNVQIDGGPRVASSGAVEVDAYDSIEVTVPKHNNGTNGTAVVKVGPGAAADFLFLLIQTDSYKNAPLSYTSETSTKSVKLDAQQTLIGAGATGLLDKPPTSLTFTNTGLTPATVRIVVGRKAV
jgi:hypothetical protein